MKHLKIFEEFETKGIYNIDRKNRFSVEKGPHTGSWKIYYNTEKGEGNALVYNNTSPMRGKFMKISKMMDNELYLFGIETNPNNKGIGKLFLKDIFEYFNVDRLYFYSLSNHIVWNKISTKIKDDGEFALYTLEKDQI